MLCTRTNGTVAASIPEPLSTVGHYSHVKTLALLAALKPIHPPFSSCDPITLPQAFQSVWLPTTNKNKVYFPRIPSKAPLIGSNCDMPSPAKSPVVKERGHWLAAEGTGETRILSEAHLTCWVMPSNILISCVGKLRQ